MKGKNIIVIGGSSGIGKAVAEKCVALEANVTITSRSLTKAEEVAKQIGNTVKGSQLDVNHEVSVIDFFNTHEIIDHIYIAAGATKLGALTDEAIEESMKAFDTRILGSLRVIKAAVHKMINLGSIIFTGGVSTARPIAGAWVSGLATSTAEQLARVMVMEFPNVRFNAVSPGWTDTPMWDEFLGDEKETVFSEVAAKLPVKKIATPEEVADAVLFLMSNASVTGETIHVDGGGRLV
jgi:NAD(P)-dependent dehydrogenase (short-subunit alcohol dehydrogenase family)